MEAMTTMSDSNEQQVREYVIGALAALGSTCPAKYEAMLKATPVHHAIEGLIPWFFLSNPERSSEYCSKALGRPVLPFAQAVEQDMMACFETTPSENPAVVVINPWAQGEGEWVNGEVEIERLPNFDAWLVFAERIAQLVAQREREESED